MWILPKNYPLLSAFVADMVESSEDLTLPGMNIESSLMWRSKPSPLKTWQRRWKTSSWMPRLYGRILKPSHRTSFETRLTSSLEAIRVNPSQLQENGKETKTLDTCGPTSANTSEQFDLFGSSLKTSKDTSRLDSEKSLATWKKMVTSARGEYSARKKSALPTDASGSTSWATPRAADSAGGPRTLNEKGQRISVSDPTKTYGANLSDQVRHWPTPSARDHKGGSGTVVQEGDKFYRVSNTTQTRFGARLDAVVEHLHKTNWLVPETFPTPGTTECRSDTLNLVNRVTKGKQIMLTHHVRLFPTPAARDWKDSSGMAKEAKNPDGTTRRRDDQLARAIYATDNPTKGHLNPDWVEQLMGVPLGWTSLTGTNTDWTYGWHDGSWELGIPRVVESIEDRVDRIRLLGNGVVPATAAKAWTTLGERL